MSKPVRILVASDSHGCLGPVLPQVPWHEADWILFAGDGFDEATGTLHYLGVAHKTVAVSGNCDGRPAFADAEVELAGWPIWVTHGDRWGVKSGYETIAAEGRRRGARLVVFGHSHRAVHLELDGVHLFNPGSPVEPRGGTVASVGWIELTPDSATFSHLPIT